MDTLNQKTLAEFLGISQTYLSDIKAGRRTLGKKSALRISKITGIDFREISFMEGDEFLKKMTLALLVNRATTTRQRGRRTITQKGQP